MVGFVIFLSPRSCFPFLFVLSCCWWWGVCFQICSFLPPFPPCFLFFSPLSLRSLLLFRSSSVFPTIGRRLFYVQSWQWGEGRVKGESKTGWDGRMD